MFVNVAHATADAVANADASAAAPTSSGFASFIPMLLILLVFYFLLLRPQMKKQKELNNMLVALKNGDKVVAAGGIVGTIMKIEDNLVHLEISKDNVIKVLKQSIAEKINKDVAKVEDAKPKDEIKVSKVAKKQK